MVEGLTAGTIRFAAKNNDNNTHVHCMEYMEGAKSKNFPRNSEITFTSARINQEGAGEYEASLRTA
jgi:hypothetical protein